MDKSVWVEVKGGWHELKFHVLHKTGVDYVFIEHIAFERPGTPYGDHTGPFKDNLFRYGTRYVQLWPVDAYCHGNSVSKVAVCLGWVPVWSA